MSNNNITGFTIKRLGDQEVISAFQAVLKDCQASLASNRFTTFGGKHTFEKSDDKDLLAILALKSIVLRSFSFVLNNNLSIQIDRDVKGDTQEFQSLHDNLRIHLHQTPQGAVDAVAMGKVITSCRKHFEAADDRSYIDYLSEGDKSYYEAREASLQRLETMQGDFFSKLQDFTISQTEQYQKRRTDLEQQHATKMAALDADHQEKLKALGEREVQLEQKIKEFDNRESKLVRRQIREQLKKIIADRGQSFELTKGTIKRRLPVLVLYAALLLVLGAGAVYYLYQDLPTGGGGANAWTIARQIVFTVGFALTAGFCIKWANQWAQRHAEEEFKLKQLELDIDRASWVVEMALEWKAEKDSDIPQYIIERLTRNLFAEDAGHDGPMTPAEAVAHMLTNGATAKLKVGDSEISLDKKSLASSRKKVEK